MSDLHHDPVLRAPAAARIREFETRFASATPAFAGSASRAHRDLTMLLDRELKLGAPFEVA